MSESRICQRADLDETMNYALDVTITMYSLNKIDTKKEKNNK